MNYKKGQINQRLNIVFLFILVISMTIPITLSSGGLHSKATITSPYDGEQFVYDPSGGRDDRIDFKWTVTFYPDSDTKVYYKFDSGNWIYKSDSDGNFLLTKYASDFTDSSHDFYVKVVYTKFGPDEVISEDEVEFEITIVAGSDISFPYLNDHDYIGFPIDDYKRATVYIEVGKSDSIQIYVDGEYRITLYEGYHYTEGTKFTAKIYASWLLYDGYSSAAYCEHHLLVKNYVGGYIADQDELDFFAHWNTATIRIKIIRAGNGDGKGEFYVRHENGVTSEYFKLKTTNSFYAVQCYTTYEYYERGTTRSIELRKNYFWGIYQIYVRAYIKVSSTIHSDFTTDHDYADEKQVYTNDNKDGFLRLEEPDWAVAYEWGAITFYRRYSSTLWFALEISELKI